MDIGTLFSSTSCITISLGGAIAALMAFDIRYCQHKASQGKTCPIEISPSAKISIYTYGQLRFGNEEFVKVFQSLMTSRDDSDMVDGSYYRVINAGDVVPIIPPTVLGYRHYEGVYYAIDKDSMSIFVYILNNI